MWANNAWLAVKMTATLIVMDQVLVDSLDLNNVFSIAVAKVQVFTVKEITACLTVHVEATSLVQV